MAPDLHVAAVHTHASDHAALRGHIRPVDHLLGVVEVQRHGIIQTLEQSSGACSQVSASPQTLRADLSFLSSDLSIAASHLFDEGVVGAIQVELPQVVPVGEDQVRLLLCRQQSRETMSRCRAASERWIRPGGAAARLYLTWTCRWWGRWGSARSRPRTDSGSCREC